MPEIHFLYGYGKRPGRKVYHILRARFMTWCGLSGSWDPVEETKELPMCQSCKKVWGL